MQDDREILIIEDNPGDVRLMREALKDVRPPVSVHDAMDLDTALRFLRQQGEFKAAKRPSMIFLDFNLQGSSSRAVLSEIKSDEALHVIPVIVLTSSDSERDIRDAYDLHANCYLCKPGDLDSFLRTIQLAAEFWLNMACLPSVRSRPPM